MISGGAIHVLVVDDEPLALKVIAGFLERRGHRVTTAHDGNDALRAFRSGGADIVITDLRMPNLGGLELARILRRESPNLPIIGLTGDRSIVQERQISRLVINELVCKPLDLQAFEALVKSLVET